MLIIKNCPRCKAAERNLLLVLKELAKHARFNNKCLKDYTMPDPDAGLNQYVKAISGIIRRLREDNQIS